MFQEFLVIVLTIFAFVFLFNKLKKEWQGEKSCAKTCKGCKKLV